MSISSAATNVTAGASGEYTSPLGSSGGQARQPNKLVLACWAAAKAAPTPGGHWPRSSRRPWSRWTRWARWPSAARPGAATMPPAGRGCSAGAPGPRRCSSSTSSAFKPSAAATPPWLVQVLSSRYERAWRRIAWNPSISKRPAMIAGYGRLERGSSAGCRTTARSCKAKATALAGPRRKPPGAGRDGTTADGEREKTTMALQRQVRLPACNDPGVFWRTPTFLPRGPEDFRQMVEGGEHLDTIFVRPYFLGGTMENVRPACGVTTPGCLQTIPLRDGTAVVAMQAELRLVRGVSVGLT